MFWLDVFLSKKDLRETGCHDVSCWWFRNPANQLRLIGSLSHVFQGFFSSQVLVWDYWTIKSIRLIQNIACWFTIFKTLIHNIHSFTLHLDNFHQPWYFARREWCCCSRRTRFGPISEWANFGGAWCLVVKQVLGRSQSDSILVTLVELWNIWRSQNLRDKHAMSLQHTFLPLIKPNGGRLFWNSNMFQRRFCWSWFPFWSTLKSKVILLPSQAILEPGLYLEIFTQGPWNGTLTSVLED